MSNQLNHEVAGRLQDALTLAIGMAWPNNPSLDQLAGALTLFLDHSIDIASNITGVYVSDDDGKDIRKKVYGFIVKEIERHAVNSE